MKILTLIVVLFISFSLVQAGTITLDFGTPLTITTTAGQDANIQRILDVENVRRAAQVPPLSTLTKEQYLQQMLKAQVLQVIGEAQRQVAVEACTNYQVASGAVKTQIDNALGGKSPCP